MSDAKKKPTAPKLPPTIIATDWLKAEVRWSPKWKDTVTGKAGSTFYFIRLGQTDTSNADFETDDGATTSIGVQRVWFADQKEYQALPKIQFNGGEGTYTKLKEQMPELYINCNKEYTGFLFYMSVERYNRYIAEGKVVLSSSDIKNIATQLPS